MSAWRSPLLILGIVVILVAGGALFAPLFIDWGNYRGEFEKYGRQITGRETQVVGDISVRLFPWPRMKIKDVRVANPPGAIVTELFRADEIDVRLRLAPLLSGKLEVESINVDRPVIGLERLASGKGSWRIKPETELGKLFGADDVAVSGVSITNGTIVLADGQRGGEAQLDGFNAFVSARSLNGPWKLRGEAVVNDQGVTISLNTGKIRADQPLKFGLRLGPNERAGLTYVFDGQTNLGDKHEITGSLKIFPTASEKGKADGQSNFRPVVFRSTVKADFDHVRFSKIEVAPKNAVDVRTFVTGDALVKLGSIIRVDTKLKAARFDVDSVLGNRGRKTLRSLKSLDVAAGFIEQVPKNVHLHAAIDLTTLVIGGESVDGAYADLDVIESRLKVNRLAVSLPGQAKATFKGSLLAGSGLTGARQPQLIGDLALDVISLKDFTKWVGEDYQREIEKKWAGTRGRFQLAAKVDLSRKNFRLNDGKFTLDEATGTIGLSVTTGKEPAIAIELVSNKLDIDRYAPEGLLEASSKNNLPGFFIESLAGLVGERDVSLSAKADKLLLNGVEAGDIALEFNANENAVEFRQFKLGHVGDAFVDLSGLVKFSDDDDNVFGSVDGVIKASNPKKLVQLIIGDRPSASWIKAVSPLELKISGSAVAEDKLTKASGDVTGTIGVTNISGKGRFNGVPAHWQTAKLHLSGEMEGKSAKALFAVFGVTIPRGNDGKGKLALTATGNLKSGLAAAADVSALGVQSQFAGQISGGLKDLRSVKAKGRLAVLVENTDQLFSVAGIHPGDASPIGKVFSGEGQIEAGLAGLVLTEIRGTAAGTSFSGSTKIDFSSALPILKMNLKTGRLSLPFILDSTLLGRDGSRHTQATRFSPDAISGLNMQIQITAEKLGLWQNFEVRNATLLMTTDKGLVKVATAGERMTGKQVQLDLNAQVGERLTKISGKISGTVLVSDLLQTDASKEVLAGGVQVIGKFDGSGRTPGGLLAGLSGNGNYEISDGVVKNISPIKFSAQLPKAETAKDVEAVIANALRVGDMEFGNGKGEIELQNGVATFVPLVIKGHGAQGIVQVIYEIANGLADVSIRLKLDDPADVPGFEIAYAGPPDKLTPSSDFAALKSHLTVAALNRTLDKLQALEEEQRRLVEEEKKARAEAEEKRKAQQEKQRLLRQKQRRLLEEATRKQKEKKEQAETLPDLPEVKIQPETKPQPPISSTDPIVNPEVKVETLPPVATQTPAPPIEPPVPVIVPPPAAIVPPPVQKTPKSIGNWLQNREIDDPR